jgi:excisionase family DNA binding protein
LGISKQVAYKLVRQGQIPHVRMGRPVRFDPAAVAAWLDAGGTAAGNGETGA